MARVTVEDCLEKENNRFSLVILAAQRAKELLNGAKSKVTDSENKQVVTALREIADGQVRFMTPDDLAKKHKREQEEREAALAAARERSSSVGLSLESSSNNMIIESAENGNGNGNGKESADGVRIALGRDSDSEVLFDDNEDDGEE